MLYKKIPCFNLFVAKYYLSKEGLHSFAFASVMCQDIDVLNFTKITNSLGRNFHLFTDMPITCKGDVSGVVLNSIAAV